ncbi:bis(5'-nucleosyl)-tetraphosphatase (symmetrical) YqeK [Paenibacillus sp.]|uniref:bis(5'-nucleosyl)-tetraphosphatase (symmetrical) YqeK n=1 Tax=Paenibacillus sp. TaxID=58172 RepID=UPI002812566B|nr:bis(5'-nucleosyl)-tetraphosphatase (symmetrical) YqeK [Paenibacillus sp.]
MSGTNAYQRFIGGIEFSGDVREDVQALFEAHHDQETLDHTLHVANEAVRIARRFGVDETLASEAALLHDVSNVVPIQWMLSVVETRSIDILEEEIRFPRIIHQKLSKDMAKEIFGCTNLSILNAIECHTTLKAGASQLDKVLFAADKVSWNLPGAHPYQQTMRNKLEAFDLDGAVLVYLNHVWEQRDKLKVVHSWLMEARQELLSAL